MQSKSGSSAKEGVFRFIFGVVVSALAGAYETSLQAGVECADHIAFEVVTHHQALVL